MKDDVFLFNEYEFLFHVTNLTKIYLPYKERFYNYYNSTTEELILMKKIKNYSNISQNTDIYED